jgi:hypothetical protein
MTTPETLSSHMPILMEAIEAIRPATVLEFGSGFFSSRLFLSRVPEVWSIESRQEWFDKLDCLRFEYPHWSHVCSDKAVEYATALNRNFNLVFVDNCDRMAQCRFAFDHAGTVVMHDSQKADFQLPSQPWLFKRFVFTQFPVKYSVLEHGDLDQRPWTTLWTMNTNLAYRMNYWIEHETELYAKHRYPYFPDPVVKA